MAEYKQHIVNRCRKARQAAGFGHKEAADDLGGDIDKPGVNGPYAGVESGRKSVSTALAIKIADLFNTSAEKLIGIRGYKDPVKAEA